MQVRSSSASPPIRQTAACRLTMRLMTFALRRRSTSILRVPHCGIYNRLEARPFGSRRRMSGQPGLEKERMRR